MTDIVERLEAHMGKAEIQDVLTDCREGAAEIRRLRDELAKAKSLLSRWTEATAPSPSVRADVENAGGSQ